MKKLLTLVLALFLTLSLTACGSASTQESGSAAAQASAGAAEETFSADGSAAGELTTVRAAVMTNGDMHWYAVLGQDTGIFEKYGLDVQISEFAAGVNTVDAIVTDQADIGNLADYAAVNRLGNTQDNTNLRIVARLSTSEGSEHSGLYVDPEKIHSIEDLAGQGFATQPGTVWDYWVAKTYEYANIPEDQQNVLNCDSATSAVAVMISGEAAAFWASGVNAAKLEEAGFEKLMTLSDLDLYTDAYYIVPTSYLEEHADVVEAYLRASQEIAEWTYANKEEAAAIVADRLGTTEEQFLEDLESNQLVIDFPQSTLDHLNSIKEWAVGNGSFADFDLLDYTDLTALEQVNPDGITLD